MTRRLAQLAELSVTKLDGVGPKKAEALHEVGVDSVLDLVTHYPRRYLDRTQQAEISALRVGDEAMVLARVKRAGRPRRTQSRLTLV
ncbi:MAG TPA: DNA helicase RecG, partial [Candidatus Dormibacteraeota bacterium]